MSIGYNLKLPNYKRFISVTSPDVLDHTKYIEFQGTIFKIKIKYMTSESGEVIEVINTKEEPEKIIKLNKYVNPYLL
jgi:hypothetical protein